MRTFNLETEKVLEKLGIDIKSNLITVFKSILLAAGGLTTSVTFNEISAHLKKFEGKRFTKAYLYRLIKELEVSGFITADPIQHPKEYAITQVELTKTLEQKRNKALSSLLSNRQDLTTKLNLLKSTNPQDFAITVYDQLVGAPTIVGSMIIEGIENVRTAVIREFAEVAKAGDIVRVLAPGSLLDGGLEQSGLAEKRLMDRSVDGVKMAGVMIPQKHHEFTTELIINYLRNMGDSLRIHAESGNLTLKVAKEYCTTYRMVTLNNEKILLYLTHSAESDIAALIHRKDNPGVIDDAIRTFDRLFEEGLNIMDIVKKSITPH